MTTPPFPQATRDSLPERADVVVIGGGIVGVSAALFLAQSGLSVVLCEKGRIAGEQSSRNWGWVRQMGRDRRELPLMIKSSTLWQELAEQIARETGEDIGFRRNGTTYLAETEAEMAHHLRWYEAHRGFDIDTRPLSAEQTDTLLGRDDRRFAGALHTPSDAMAEPARAVPALAELARRQGVQLLERCAVRSIERSAGRVSAVLTEHGPLPCEAAIVAGGAWTRSLLEHLGQPFPQLAVKSSVLRTSPVADPGALTGPIGATGASIRPRQDGGFSIARAGAAEFQLIPAGFRHFRAFLPILRNEWRILKFRVGREFFGPLGQSRWSAEDITPFERTRVLDPAPDQRLLRDTMNSARALHPQLADARLVESWAGMIDVMPDDIPVIDQIPGFDRLFVASGFSGHGFGIGPGAGQLIAQLLMDQSPLVDPAPFALARFASTTPR